MNKKEDYKDWWFFAVFLVVIAGLPTLLTRPSKWELFDFSTTGNIGDTIGGITAPIVGLISIFYLIKAFREQRNANNVLQKQLAEEKSKNEKEEIDRLEETLLENLKGEIISYKAEFIEIVNRFRNRIDEYAGNQTWENIDVLNIIFSNYSRRARQVHTIPDYDRTIFPFTVLLKSLFETFKLSIEGCMHSPRKLQYILTKLEYFIISEIWVPAQILQYEREMDFHFESRSFIGKELLFVIYSFHKLEMDLCQHTGMTNNRSRFGETYEEYYRHVESLNTIFRGDNYYSNMIYEIPRPIAPS